MKAIDISGRGADHSKEGGKDAQRRPQGLIFGGASPEDEPDDSQNQHSRVERMGRGVSACEGNESACQVALAQLDLTQYMN